MKDLLMFFRVASAQTSGNALINVVEKYARKFTGANAARLLVVERGSVVRRGVNRFEATSGLLAEVLKYKEAMNVDDVRRESRFVRDYDEVTPHDRAMLIIPLEADIKADASGGKETIALLQVSRHDAGQRFSTREVKLLTRLADFAGNLVKNSRSWDSAFASYNASVSVSKRNAALLEVSMALASENRLENLVSFIVSKVPELLDADRCTCFFVDKEKKELIVTKQASKGRPKSFVGWIFGQINAPELPFEDGCNEIRFPMSSGLAGYVATTGSTLNLPDAHNDPRFNSSIDKETGYRTRSVLCVPMIDDKGEIIGVVQAINKNPTYPQFDDEEAALLKTFAAQAALAVRTCQLIERTRAALAQSEALLEVTMALSRELKIEALIKIICSKVQELLDAERTTVFICDHDRKMLYTSDQMSYGMGPALPIDRELSSMIHFPMDRGIAGSVATSGKVVNIEDAYKDERFNKAMDQKTGYRTRSILCLPVVNTRDQVVGVLQVMNKRKGRFIDDDEKLLNAFCAQAAVAIDNNLLFQQTEKALNQALAEQRNLKFLLSVTKNLFSDLHLTSMIDQMTMQVHHLLKADDCALYLVDQKTKRFHLAKDDTDSNAKKFPFSAGIVGEVARTGQTIRISKNAFKHPLFNSEVDQRKESTTQSLLCCPIKIEAPDGEVVIGVISVRDEQDRGGFEQEEEKLLKVFCQQAAVAIQNARRFSSITDQTEFTSKTDMSYLDILKTKKGMHLATSDINAFQYRMDEIILKGEIGRGSYGEVFRAIARGKLVAVKKLKVRNLRAEQIDAFCKEASLMCQLENQHIVGFIGAVTEPHHLCIITEYCARGSMADLLLDESIPMDYPRKIKFAKDAAKGMAYLHGSNPIILHRDLKSDNLLVAEDWTVKVGDFGLTRFISEKKIMTQVGTPMWMAPEIISGKQYTEKADVYAFGIILWEIMTRLEPYEDKEPMQIVMDVVKVDLRPDIPKEHDTNPLVPLMKDCWHRDPDHRPTFPAIVDRLEKIEQLCKTDPRVAGLH